MAGGGEGGGRTHLLLALGHLTVDHASLSRRDTVPTPDRDTSNIWALITVRFFHILHKKCLLLSYPRPVRRLIGGEGYTQFVHGCIIVV